MNIEIKNKFNGNIIIVGEYENIKDALLKNRGANLHGADLYGANLYGADLCGANLRDANLRDADLRDADLYGADLYGADLYGADLYGADLRDADLYGAKNIKLPIISLNGSRHSLFYINGTIQIGCEKYTVEKWVSDYVAIGTNNGYSDSEIEEYYTYINMIANLIKEA